MLYQMYDIPHEACTKSNHSVWLVCSMSLPPLHPWEYTAWKEIIVEGMVCAWVKLPVSFLANILQITHFETMKTSQLRSLYLSTNLISLCHVFKSTVSADLASDHLVMVGNQE